MRRCVLFLLLLLSLPSLALGPTYLDRTGWTASVTTFNPGNPASLVLDGSTATYWWSGANVPQPVTIDMGSAQTFNEVGVTPNSRGDYPTTMEVYTSPDNTTWTKQKTGSFAADTTRKKLQFPDVTVRYFRVTVTASSGGWTQIAEIDAATEYLDNLSVAKAGGSAVLSNPGLSVAKANSLIVLTSPGLSVAKAVVYVVLTSVNPNSGGAVMLITKKEDPELVEPRRFSGVVTGY